MNGPWAVQTLLTAAEILCGLGLPVWLFGEKPEGYRKAVFWGGGAALIGLTLYQRRFWMYSRYYMVFCIFCCVCLVWCCLKYRRKETTWFICLYFETIYYLDVFCYIAAKTLASEANFIQGIHLSVSWGRIWIYLVSRIIVIAFFCGLGRWKRNFTAFWGSSGKFFVMLCVMEYFCLFVLDRVFFVEWEREAIHDWKLLLSLCMVLLIAGVLYVAYRKYRVLYERQSLQNELYACHYRDGLAHMQELERIYHDEKNHLIMINRMLCSGEVEKARKYLVSLLGKVTETDAGRTGIPLLDYLLSEKEMRAKQEGMEVGIMCTGEWFALGESCLADWCALLGNLWDNAIEGCKSGELPGWIRFAMYRNGAVVQIDMENSCARAKNGGIMKTSKSDARRHGIGLRSVFHVVDAYGGKWEYSCENGVFCMKIMMFV